MRRSLLAGARDADLRFLHVEAGASMILRVEALGPRG